jgi:hypothetical protein
LATAISVTDNEVIVEFKDGAPVAISDDGAIPQLLFKDETDMVIAMEDTDFSVEGSALLDIKGLPNNFDCSFNGGCYYTIVAPGLSTSLEEFENNSIEVCGNTCNFVDSTSGQATCLLEPLVSRYSV